MLDHRFTGDDFHVKAGRELHRLDGILGRQEWDWSGVGSGAFGGLSAASVGTAIVRVAINSRHRMKDRFTTGSSMAANYW